MLKIAMFLLLTGCGAYGQWGDDDAAAQQQADAKATSAGNDASTTTYDAAPQGDAGTPDAASAVDANYGTPVVCTSGTYWTLGTTKSASMQPGVACRSCHVVFGQASSYDFDISGTVYPTAHEPDQCNGIGSMNVVITDANGTDHTLAVNSVGNFYNNDGFGLLRSRRPTRRRSYRPPAPAR